MKHIAVQNFHHSAATAHKNKGVEVRAGELVDLDKLPEGTRQQVIDQGLVRLATKQEILIAKSYLEEESAPKTQSTDEDKKKR